MAGLFVGILSLNANEFHFEASCDSDSANLSMYLIIIIDSLKMAFWVFRSFAEHFCVFLYYKIKFTRTAHAMHDDDFDFVIRQVEFWLKIIDLCNMNWQNQNISIRNVLGLFKLECAVFLFYILCFILALYLVFDLTNRYFCLG